MCSASSGIAVCSLDVTLPKLGTGFSDSISKGYRAIVGKAWRGRRASAEVSERARAHEASYEDVVARAISRNDLGDDVRGINASIELIRRTRGGNWPSEPVTEDFNYVDLVWHELEFREGDSFTYAVSDADGAYLGCAYLYPLGRRQPLTEELLRVDVDVSWWVTPDAYERGYYEKLYRALRHWVAHDFPFEAPHYSNAEIPPD